MAGCSPCVSRNAMTQHADSLLAGREVFRLDVDRDAEMVAPAPQFHQPVRLPLGRPLRQRQATGGGEDRAEIHRPDAHAGAMRHGHRLDARRAHMRPRRVQRRVVVDVQGHAALPSRLVMAAILREADGLGKAGGGASGWMRANFLLAIKPLSLRAQRTNLPENSHLTRGSLLRCARNDIAGRHQSSESQYRRWINCPAACTTDAAGLASSPAAYRPTCSRSAAECANQDHRTRRWRRPRASR